MEIWKDIKGYEGIYIISNLGNIKSLGNNKSKKEKNLKPAISSTGYLNVVLSKKGKKNTKTIHQIVAESFLNHTPCGYELVVNHINFNRLDNRLENLEIVSQRQNANKNHLKSTSKYTGVYWHKSNKHWCSSIQINGVQKHLGNFDSEISAYKAYLEALLNIKASPCGTVGVSNCFISVHF